MIDVIDLGNYLKPQKVRVLLFQFEIQENDWQIENDLYFLKNKRLIEEKINRITLLAIEKKVDIIVFPENSIPKELITILEDLSAQHKIIIIAGSQYYIQSDKTISMSPVIVNGEIYFTHKITASPFEISPFAKKGLHKGEKVFVFKNSLIGNFSVLICTDYLSREIRNKILDYNLDFLIVIAFQSKSAIYHSRMNNNCEECEPGLYIIYSNLLGYKSDGNSAFFGHLDRIFLEKIISAGHTDTQFSKKIFSLGNKDGAAYCIADFNLLEKKPSFARFLNTFPNVHIIEHSQIEK